MYDLCRIFKNLQQMFQKSDLILLDVLTARDAAIVNLNVLKEIPVSGGEEERYPNGLAEEDIEEGGARTRRTG